MQNDPLWNMRHALAGVGIATLASVFIAAALGSALAPIWGDSYGMRVAIYSALLVYTVVGAVVLFVKLAKYETQPLSFGRVGRWLASLWVWPLLLLMVKKG